MVSDRRHNLAPADRLAHVREEIRLLKIEEEALRGGFIDGEHELIGDDYAVLITTTKSERIDIPTLKKELGMAKLRPFVTEHETTYVKIKRRG